MQVIVRTTYPGQAPQIVEDQVTYPLTTTMLSVPGAKTVRGYSFFGDSFVYVLFDDGTDLVLGALARARVPEPGAGAAAGAGASRRSGRMRPASAGSISTRWSTAAGKHDLGAAARAAGLVPEVRAEGGARRRRGRRDRRHGAPVPDRARSRTACAPTASRTAAVIAGAAERQPGDRRLGASSWPRPSTWCARAATCKTLDDFRRIPADDRPTRRAGAAARRRARCRSGPRCAAASPSSTAKARSPAASSSCAPARTRSTTIEAVKAQAASCCKPACRRASRSSTTYDRSRPDRARGRATCATSCSRSSSSSRSSARSSCSTCARRSSPSSRCRSACWSRFIVMRCQGVNANIMSLGGIAIAIGAMVDAAIVMIENAHKHLEALAHAHPGQEPSGAERWQVIARRRGRGRAGAVLLAAHHHAVVRAGVHARGAGRPAVRAARLHQDLRDGRGGGAVGHAGAGADGLSHPRPHSRTSGAIRSTAC